MKLVAIDMRNEKKLFKLEFSDYKPQLLEK